MAYLDFESMEDGLLAVIDDSNQRRLYEIMMSMHIDDRLVWLEGVLDCADTFQEDVEGLRYIHDEIMEVGESVGFREIDKMFKQLTGVQSATYVSSTHHFSETPFVVTMEFYDECDGAELGDPGVEPYTYEEIVYALNARTASAIANSRYKRNDHIILEVKPATDADMQRLQDRIVE